MVSLYYTEAVQCTDRARAGALRWRSSEFGQLISFSFSDTLIIRVVITTHDGGGGGGGENSDVCLVSLSLNLL